MLDSIDLRRCVPVLRVWGALLCLLAVATTAQAGTFHNLGVLRGDVIGQIAGTAVSNDTDFVIFQVDSQLEGVWMEAWSTGDPFAPDRLYLYQLPDDPTKPNGWVTWGYGPGRASQMLGYTLTAGTYYLSVDNLYSSYASSYRLDIDVDLYESVCLPGPVFDIDLFGFGGDGPAAEQLDCWLQEASDEEIRQFARNMRSSIRGWIERARKELPDGNLNLIALRSASKVIDEAVIATDRETKISKTKEAIGLLGNMGEVATLKVFLETVTSFGPSVKDVLKGLLNLAIEYLAGTEKAAVEQAIEDETSKARRDAADGVDDAVGRRWRQGSCF